MRLDIIFISLVLGVLCIASIARSASSVPKDSFLGISPEDENYYKSSSEIKCKDGSKKFTRAQLNDDFCDCPDGTDEPGTSACQNAKFYCRNARHVPQFLFSSRVNDGICDCCDGSDEYDGKVKCPNTCWEAGKLARDKLNKKIATYQEGVVLRKQEVEEAKSALAKDEAELTKLKSEEKILKGLVQQLKERKEQIEKTEEKERLQKEKEEKEAEDAAKYEKGEAEGRYDSDDKPTGSAHDDVIGTLEDSPSDQELAEVESRDTSENQVSPVNIADQYAVENKEKSLSSESKDDSAVLSKTGQYAGNEVSADEVTKVHAVENKEESLSSESKDDSAVLSKTGHNAGNEVSADEVMKVLEDGVAENTEGLSREELGRLVASRWTGGKTEEQTGEADSDHEGHEEMPKDSRDEEYDGYATETDDDTGKYDNDVENEIDEASEEEDHNDSSSLYKSDIDDEVDLSDTTTSNPSWLEKIQRTVKSILQAVNLFQTPVDKSEAARVRKEYDESSAKLSKIQSRISSLTQKLKQDFGPEKEFYSFYGRCFENKQNKYVYKVCPYKQASQVEGHSITRLGDWDKFDDSYHTMIFSNGEKCWNGPDRSMKVKLRCGLKNEVTDVDEPSRCEYMALLYTPAICVEEKLKELQQKLDLMNQEQPQKHDEL